MIYYTPTKLFIDNEAKEVGSIINQYGYKNVLVLYGGGSALKSGLIKEVTDSLEEAGISYNLEGGIRPNPEISFIRDILNKDYKIDLLLAVGGGSVIDTAKSIAVSYKTKKDPWDYSLHKETPTEVLPIGVILTIAAAGSEMSNSCVISNDETHTKQGFNSDLIRPLFAIMNPKYTFGVSKYQTACGVVDIMMHTLERFLNDNQSDLASNLAIGVLKTVYDNGLVAFNNPTDYEARKQLMLASSFSHNGLTSVGVKNYFRVHQFEHVVSGFFPEVAHGAGLSVAFLAYAKETYKNEIAFPKFLRLAYEVFGVESTSNKEEDALKGILAMEEYFKKLEMPIYFEDLNIDYSYLEPFTMKLTNNKTRIIPDFILLDYETCYNIFDRMWKK